MKEFIQLTYSFCFLACLLDGGHIIKLRRLLTVYIKQLSYFYNKTLCIFHDNRAYTFADMFASISAGFKAVVYFAE